MDVLIFNKNNFWGLTLMNIMTCALATLVLGVCISSPSVVHASNLLDTLLENGAITQKQYEELGRQQQEQKFNVPAASGQKVIVNTTGGLSGRSPDGTSTFRLRGRLQLDAAFYDDGAFDDNGDIVKPGNGTEVRRAFLSLEGRVWNDWEYELEMDFGENEPELIDAFIRYIGAESWDFRIGHIKEPFSLEEQTSNTNITFLERALPNEFAPERNFGIDAQTYGDNWSIATGIFGEQADDKKEQDEGVAITGRATYAPILEESSLIHLGASVTYRHTGDEKEVRFRARPESHISDVRYVNTGKINGVDDLSSYGVEFVMIYGSFSVQGEYIATRLFREEGASDLDFDGYYLYGSWVLTGESRSYRDRKGEFSSITPRSIVGKGGAGAWELGLRYSHLDLNDEEIIGGTESNQTLGLNWYATPNIRFMFNIIHVESEQDDGVDNEDTDIFQARTQLVF